MRLKLELVERQQDISQDKGMFGYVCVLDNGLVFVFRHLRSGLIYVLIYPWLCPRPCAVGLFMFVGNIKVSGQVLAVRGHFLGAIPHI